MKEGFVVLPIPAPVKTDSTLGQRLLEFAGTIEGLPPDMASNHYIHGLAEK